MVMFRRWAPEHDLRSKTMVQQRNILFGVLAAGVTLSLALSAGRTHAADPASCKAIYASGETYANSPSTFEGSAFTNLGEFTVSVALLGTKDTGNGLVATTSHTFHGQEAAFTTMDNATLVELSPGLYLLNTQASIVEGGWGNVSIDGLVDFRTGTARWFAKGRLCQR
jgi:hypothetical protein